jgi:peptidoglycan/LPS O-acetylase OafA/YrhL
MPLNEHEQRILEEIERRLSEDDPRLVDQVTRTSLYTHVARRIRLASGAFVLGLVLLLLVGASVWVAAAGFVLMILSATLVYRYVGQLGRDQLRTMQRQGDASIPGVLGRIAVRIAGRLRRSAPDTRPDD